MLPAESFPLRRPAAAGVTDGSPARFLHRDRKSKGEKDGQSTAPCGDARPCRPRLARYLSYVQFCGLLRSEADPFRGAPGVERRYRGSRRGVRNPPARQYGDRFDSAFRGAATPGQYGVCAGVAAGRDTGDVGRYGNHAQRIQRQRHRAGEVPANMGAARFPRAQAPVRSTDAGPRRAQ